MIELNVNHLKAALECVAVKDVRYYLMGVLVEVTVSGDVHLVATDGAVLFAGLTGAESEKPGPFAIIVPTDVVKLAVKSKAETLLLSELPDGRYSLGDFVFKPVEGMFPDWRRVIAVGGDGSGEAAQVNPELMLRAQTAMGHWYGTTKNKKMFYFAVYDGPTNPIKILGTDNTVNCVVMPLRNKYVDFSAPMKPSAFK